MRAFLLRVLKPVTFTACLIPLAKIPYDLFLGSGLTANPIAEVLNRLGFWTLTLLTASLACTPAKIVLKVKWPLRIRRMLGLFAFAYAALHFGFYIGVDQFFDFKAIAADVVKRKFILVGFLAFLVLLTLAVTSPARVVRRMGFPRWKRLHRLVYLAGALGAIHFIWRVKADLRVPTIFLVTISALLLIRLIAWCRVIVAKSRAAGPSTITRARGDPRPSSDQSDRY